MGHRIRHYEPGVYYYEVVAKCCGDEMLFRPDPMTLGLIAVAVRVHGVARVVRGSTRDQEHDRLAV
jgi:hypothetical protein